MPGKAGNYCIGSRLRKEILGADRKGKAMKTVRVGISNSYKKKVLLNEEQAGQRICDLIRVHKNRLPHTALLDDARNLESPLHPVFEWDDAKAAEQHRIRQADELMQHVTITVSTQEENQRQATTNRVVIVSQKEANITTYIAEVTHAFENAGKPSRIFSQEQRAINDLINFKQKYGKIQSLAPIFQVIDMLLSKVEKKAA